MVAKRRIWPGDIAPNTAIPWTYLRVNILPSWTMAPHTAARLERTGFLLKAFADYGADSPLSAFEGTQRARTRRFLEYLCQAEFPVDVRVSGVAATRASFNLGRHTEYCTSKVHIAATPGSRFRFARDLTVEPYDCASGSSGRCALCRTAALLSSACICPANTNWYKARR
jgi:hypothetical protein